jgi:colanic acid biosynthesis glycosyl transferase WcaI
MAKILLLSLVFAPDGVSTSVLMTELAQELQKQGHIVTVLTTTPHYNLDKEARERQPLVQKWKNLLFKSELAGISVYHVATPQKGNRVGSRMLDYMRFHLISTIFGLLQHQHFDVVLTPSPPLTIGVSGWLLATFHRAPFIYNVQEIWPELPIRLGIIKNRSLITFFEWLEKFVYKRADAITVISEFFRCNLEAKGVPSTKMWVIPNFVDTAFIKPTSKLNEFSEQYKINEKFVVSYAGNIGLTQDFESVLAAAVELQHIDSLQFLIVGDGARRQWLEKQIEDLNLSNVLLLPYQLRSVVPFIYASSDLCLVPMKQGMDRDTFPSKVYTIMSSGRPVLASTDSDSELAWAVNEAKAGWITAPGHSSGIRDAILQAMTNPAECQSMGKRGRTYVINYHSPQAVAEKYDGLIQSLIRK